MDYLSVIFVPPLDPPPPPAQTLFLRKTVIIHLHTINNRIKWLPSHKLALYPKVLELLQSINCLPVGSQIC